MTDDDWDIDARGLKPPATEAERIARDRRYERLKARGGGGGGGGDFLQSVLALFLPSVRHAVEQRQENKGVRFDNGDNDPEDPDTKFSGRITLPGR